VSVPGDWSQYSLSCHWARTPLLSSCQSSWLQNGDVLCFLWGTNLIYICYVEESSPPLWSICQSSWLQNGNILCFLWGTNWIYICYVEESSPPLWSSGQSSWLQNGDIFCFLWGTNWIYICYVEESRPPMLSSGQSSWLQNGDVLCFLARSVLTTAILLPQRLSCYWGKTVSLRMATNLRFADLRLTTA
jgi:hypothetical protein